MKVVCKLLLGLALLQGAAYAADEPKIDVIDGKISISAHAVPLGRFLKMFDRATGLNSEVKTGLGLENWNISVEFTDLNFDAAVSKIFQGQPLNYMVIKGKGIKVMDKAQGGATTGVADSQPFNTPVNTPFNNPPQSLNSPIQQIQPQQNPIQPAQMPNIFGTPPPAAANPGAANPSAPLNSPGVMPPPLGANNPLINPVGGAGAGGNVFPNSGPAVMPSSQPQPPAPGTIPGATPGAAGTIK